MRTAIRDAARWQNDGAARVRLNVNLSPREFQEGDVLSRLDSFIGSHRVDPRRIDLEITETSYIDSPEETMYVLRALTERGIHLWLDDFGTGHSSLELLQHFPLYGVKIASQFVAECITDQRCRSITKAILGLAHEIGLQVIAEGIEHRDQLEFLREHRCEMVQGFLLSRPMQLDDFLRLVV